MTIATEYQDNQTTIKTLRLLKKTEVCASIGLSARTLEKLIKNDLFPQPRRLGRYMYWCESAVKRWLSEQFIEQNAWFARRP